VWIFLVDREHVVGIGLGATDIILPWQGWSGGMHGCSAWIRGKIHGRQCFCRRLCHCADGQNIAGAQGEPGINFSVPAGHAWHVSPFVPLNPGLHKHADCDVLASSESAFARHISHSDDPLVSLYLPARHATHTPPFSPDHPTLHVQASAAMLCAGEREFAAHV